MVREASDRALDDRHEDETSSMYPIDPHAFVHYVTACQVARVSVTGGLGPSDLRSLIQHLSRLSIPDAVTLLCQKVQP